MNNLNRRILGYSVYLLSLADLQGIMSLLLNPRQNQQTAVLGSVWYVS